MKSEGWGLKGRTGNRPFEGGVRDMTISAKSIVPKIGEPDIDESYIRQCDAVLLETLLIDRTMTAVNDGNPMEGGK